MRPSKRQNNALRNISIETSNIINAEGSCLIKCGNTHIICTVTLDNNVPHFLRNTGKGWITAEYGMLPVSSNPRIKREASIGKQSGRTQEIQRLIGRSLRASMDLNILGEKQLYIDCDVINADGGTRTTSITGSYVALHLAISSLLKKKILKTNPILRQIAAISCGIYKNNAVVDLDYSEDSNADVDANFVFASDGSLIEVQTTAENKPFSEEQFNDMLKLAKQSMGKIFKIQNEILLGI